MWDLENHEGRNHHLQALPAGGQPEEQTGDSGQSDDEGNEPQEDTGQAVYENSDPPDRRNHRKDRVCEGISVNRISCDRIYV